MPVFPNSNIEIELVVDQTETTMLSQEGGMRMGTEKTLRNGSTLQASFKTLGGIGVPHTFSLTPTSDGKTAQVLLQGFMIDQTAVFHRVAE